MFQKLWKAWMCLCLIGAVLSTQSFADSIYDRDLVLQDKTRAMKVEEVFKQLLAAYEDEDAQGFLALVSDDRFRQDYITFTDALYSDFRNNDIYRVDYWIDRVVSDHIKQFIFVKWEKKYENLNDGSRVTQKGYSRFLFDEINGKYLLIELAGNSLFGGTLKEWTDEVPPISGQVQPQASGSGNALPDLIVTSGRAWTSGFSPAGPSQLTVECLVRNIGTGPSGTAVLKVDIYSMAAGSDTEFVTISPIAAGGEESILRTFEVPYDAVSALEIDPDNDVQESNEDNNTATVENIPM